MFISASEVILHEVSVSQANLQPVPDRKAVIVLQELFKYIVQVLSIYQMRSEITELQSPTSCLQNTS